MLHSAAVILPSSPDFTSISVKHQCDKSVDFAGHTEMSIVLL